MQVCAVIVHYRCLAHTEACVASLRRTAPSLAIVIVENASGDGSDVPLAALAASSGGRVTLLRSPTNGGFGAGCNLGIERALADHADLRHVLLVNPDTTHEEGFLDALLACAERHPDAGIVGGLVLEADGRTVWCEYGAWNPWTLGPSHGPAPAGREEYETGFVTGALALVAADLLRAGLRFDPDYFLYCEDVDLSRRVVALGRTLWITRAAVVRHASAGTQTDDPPLVGRLRRGQVRWLARNRVLLSARHLTPLQQCTAGVCAWILRPLFRLLRHGTARFLPVYYRALREGHRVVRESRRRGRGADSRHV